MKILSLFFLTSTAVAIPQFNLEPKEGYVITVSCTSDETEDCAYDSYLLTDSPQIPLSTKRKKFPGLESAPAEIIDAISSAADAMRDVSYVHVAVTYKSTTYEYSFDRTTGWNSFRAVPAGKCTLKCIHKMEKQEGGL